MNDNIFKATPMITAQNAITKPTPKTTVMALSIHKSSFLSSGLIKFLRG